MARRIRDPDPVWPYLVLFVTFLCVVTLRPQPEPVTEKLNIVLQFVGSVRSTLQRVDTAADPAQMARRIRNPDPVWQYLVLFVTFSVL
jgi:hypothetical protein